MVDTQTSRKQVPSACRTCKRRKRRCDRVFPKCSSCIWLEAECNYNNHPHGTASQSSLVSRRQVKALEICPSQYPSEGLSVPGKVFTNSSIPYVLPSLHTAPLNLGYLQVGAVIIEEASKILGSMENMNSVVKKYFASVHTWIPMLSRTRFLESLPIFWGQSQCDLILLICCMRLITDVPLNLDLENTASSLYTLVKRLYSLVDSMGVISVELVQCKLLIALFEMAHGLQSAAYMSIGACSRMGVVLAIDKLPRQRPMENDNGWIRREEASRTWWSIVIADRYIGLENLERPFATKDPDPKDYLPLDDDEWDQHPNKSSISMPISTPSHIRVESFARQAQVANLLGRVLRNRSEPTSDEVFNAGEALQLERTLEAYAILLPQEASATACGSYCGPIGICSSAQLMLLKPNPHSGQQITVDTLRPVSPVLEALSGNIVDMASHFDVQLNSKGMESLAPFMPHCLYQASIIQAQLIRQRNDPSNREGLRSLQKLLKLYNERWKIAGLYYQKVEEFCSALNISR